MAFYVGYQACFYQQNHLPDPKSDLFQDLKVAVLAMGRTRREGGEERGRGEGRSTRKQVWEEREPRLRSCGGGSK